MFALPMPRAAGAKEAGQAVQNHHKRQEMRKQIAKQEEENFSPMLASWPARCRRRHTSNA